MVDEGTCACYYIIKNQLDILCTASEHLCLCFKNDQ